MLDPISQPEEPTPDVPETESSTPVEPASVHVAKAPRPRRKLLLISGLVFVALCVCAASLATILGGVWGQKGDVEATVDRFMQAAAREDVTSAYAEFSARGKRITPTDRLQEFFSQPANKALFAGYKGNQVENISVGQHVNADPDAPQGQVAEVNGTLTYDGGYSGNFEAVLEREASGWKLHSMNITVPPQKIEDYLKNK